MGIIGVLIPVALLLGGLGLLAFLWSLRSGQYEDLDGAAHRILFEDESHAPRPSAAAPATPAASRPQPGGSTRSR